MNPIQKVFQNSSDFRPFTYSGSGMYGKKCLAFRVPYLGHFLAELLGSIYPEDLQEVKEILRSLQTDNLGHSNVVYFPGWQYVDDVEHYEVDEYEDADEY